MTPAGPVVCDGLLFNASHLVLPWMADRIDGMQGLTFGDAHFPATGIGVPGRDRVTGKPCLVGGVAYSMWFQHPEGGDCQVSMVMEPGARVTRRMWRILYGFAFDTMDCRRMSLLIAEGNAKSRQHVERVGFKLEGVKPEGHGSETLMLYGLLRSSMRDGLPPIKSRGSVHHG